MSNKKTRNSNTNNYEVIVYEIALIVVAVLLIFLFLIFAAADALELRNFNGSFSHISLFITVNILVLSLFDNLRKSAQKDKIFIFIMIMITAFLYAVFRLKIFTFCLTFDGFATSVLLIISYFTTLFESRNDDMEIEVKGLKSKQYNVYGDQCQTAVLEQWKTFIEMANSSTEKRTNSNNIFMTINAALLAVISFTLDYKSIVLSIVGIVVCSVWMRSITSYYKLSKVKYDIVNEIEDLLPLRPSSYEWERLIIEEKYVGLTKIEKFLPWLFIGLYIISIVCPMLGLLPELCCNCMGR